MSVVADRLPLYSAERLARKIRQVLAPACQRIEIAGSIRRRQRMIGDIELLIIPWRQAGLYGQDDRSMLDPLLDGLVAEGRLARGRCEGDRQKQFLIPSAGGRPLDLFVVTSATWGVQLAIRTGPALFSRRLVMCESYGGLLPDGYKIEGCRVWRPDRFGTLAALETPEERDVFDILTCGWIEPENRE